MSDENTTSELEENSAIKNMRATIEREQARNAELTQQLVGQHLQTLGLEPDRGLGKAIAKGYDGEVSADAIAAYAKTEYDYEPQAAPPAAEQAVQQQQRVAQFGSASAALQPQGPEDVIASHDNRLASPDANRRDALNALEAKVQHYPVFHQDR
jgi:hypothetical protein